MASWTDKTPVFNPYVAQQPVEAMVKVGTYKQQLYDQGVQKIQTSIDNIAGMDLIRDVDKQYLRSKLNNLGRNLRTVAAGDFSSAQLVNSVTGMTNRLVQDKNIQTALYSTKVIRKGQADKELARKAGKSSPENDAWWSGQVNDYLNDTDLTTTFSGQYVEYTDVDKKLRGLAEDIKEIENEFDMPYIHDRAGQPILDKNGQKVIDMAMLQTKVKGKSAERIFNVFLDNLNEKDKQQLMITGNYHYRGRNLDTFIADTEKNFADKREMLVDLNTEMSVFLKTNPDIEPKQRAEIEAKINTLDTRLKTGLEEEKLTALNELNNLTPDTFTDYKFRLYTQTHLTNLAKDLAYESRKEAIVTNPYWNSTMQLKNYNLAAAKFTYTKGRDIIEDDQWQKTHDLKKAIAFDDVSDKNPLIDSGTVSTEGKEPTLKDVDEKIEELKDAKKLEDGQAAQAFFPGKDTEVQQKSLDSLVDVFISDGMIDIKDPDMKIYVEKSINLKKQIDDQIDDKNQVLEASQSYEEDIYNILEGEEGIINPYTGEEEYSAKELYDFKNEVEDDFSYWETKMKPGYSGTGATLSQIRRVKGEELMKKYRGKRKEPLARAYIKKYENSTEGVKKYNQVELDALNRISQLVQKHGRDIGKIHENKKAFQSKKLAEISFEYQTIDGTLDSRNKDDIENARKLLKKKEAKYAELGALDQDRMGDYSPTTVSEMMKSTSVGYTFKKYFDGSVDFIVTADGKTQKVPITAEEFRNSFPKYAGINPLTKAIERIKKKPHKSTNRLKRGDPQGAWFYGWDFGGLEPFPELARRVRVDIEGAYDGSPLYSIRIFYLNDDGQWLKEYISPENEHVNLPTLQKRLLQIGTNTVKDAFNLERLEQ